MKQVFVTVLQPASGGFGEWSWVEGVLVEGAEEIADYKDVLHDAQATYALTDELDGMIHNQRGVVYRIDEEPYPDGDPCYHYEMVWEEDHDHDV